MVMAATMWPAAHVTPRGLLLAATSGALASGVAYTIWYAVLPSLTAWRAAILQLTVPVLSAASATALLGERITVRLVVAGLLVASGVGVTLRR
jgi:drug/metabolite transporter (DMT)-like permease